MQTKEVIKEGLKKSNFFLFLENFLSRLKNFRLRYLEKNFGAAIRPMYHSVSHIPNFKLVVRW